MNIGSVDIFALHEGVELTVNSHPTATAIAIRDRDGFRFCAATIYLPVADFERAQRAVAAFNAIMSETDAEQPAEEAE